MTMLNAATLDNRDNLCASVKHDTASGCVVLLVKNVDGDVPIGMIPLVRGVKGNSLFVHPPYVRRIREILEARGGSVKKGTYPATAIPVNGYSFGFVFNPSGGDVVIPAAPEQLPDGYYNRVTKHREEMAVELAKGAGFVFSARASSLFGRHRSVIVLREGRQLKVYPGKGGVRLGRRTSSSRLLMLPDPEIKYETEQIAVACERWGKRGIMFTVPDIVEFGIGGQYA